MEQVKDRGVITPALGEIFLPPVSLFNGLIRDVSDAASGDLTAKDSEMLGRIPVFGSLFQSWLLGAREERRLEDLRRGD